MSQNILLGSIMDKRLLRDAQHWFRPRCGALRIVKAAMDFGVVTPPLRGSAYAGIAAKPALAKAIGRITDWRRRESTYAESRTTDSFGN